MDATAGTGAGEALVIRSSARGGQLVGLGLRQAFFNIITLTLYRFWARTEVRRRLWSSASINGESFEYTGLGIELFKGFLLALVVFTVPYLLVVFGAQLLPPLIGVPLLLAFVLAAYWVIGAATWLAFRYLASRTVWRGIRFQLRGSPTGFGWLAFGQSLLVSITLGWYAPRAYLVQAEALWGNLSFGDLPFGFSLARAREEKLYVRFTLLWFSLLFAYIALVMTVASGAMLQAVLAAQPGTPLDPGEPAFLGLLASGVFLIVIGTGAILALAAYNVACWRALVRGLSLDGTSFTLTARTPGYLWLAFSNALIVIFTLGLLLPVAQARTFGFIMNRIACEGTVDFSRADQAERGPGQAEGLADAFDIGIV